LLRIDGELLGFDLNGSLDFLHNRGLSDLFSVVYFSFYFMPIAFFVVLYRAGSYERIETANLAIIFGFYLSFVGNTIFPAVSPYRIMAFDSELAGLWFHEPLHHMVETLEPHRLSAFPSGHILVAAIVVGVVAMWRRDVLPVFLAWALVLWLGTIYLRYHYLIDTLVSLPLAPLCIWAAYLCRSKAH
jgi:membrane-associated phospholipid phosphatase